jgi:hypothetical protein
VTDSSDPPPKRVRRDEGEVTQWPRGLVDYVPSRTPDATPDPDEDRTRNRVLLAGRLLTVLRSRGENVDRELSELHEAERAVASGDMVLARVRVEALLGRLAGRPTAEPSASARDPNTSP